MSFNLPEAFVEKYQNKDVDWGFRDAGGNSLGELTFIRTYSRVKDDGTKEQWWEVCKRVIEGMYSIQKDYVKSNRLPWNDRKAQASAQEAYERMFTFKWTPPGRGLWMMGTDFVMKGENGGAALQNCFTSDTKLITSDGIYALGDCVDECVHVWDGSDWSSATVKSFGKQKVQRITFAPFGARSNIRVVETATPDHRWELRDGSLTTNLKVGDVVPASAATEKPTDAMHEYAFKHGMIFADGSMTSFRYKNEDYKYQMRLCGNKAQYVNVFDEKDVSYQPNCNGDPVVYFRSPFNLKAVPTIRMPDYVASFIDGWAALDGSKNAAGNIVISMQNAEAAEWLEENAAVGGYIVVGKSVDSTTHTNYGKRSEPLIKITLSRPENRYWTVKSIEELDEKEEVFCAVVPGKERFTLASGVYTSNCAFVSTADIDRNDPGYVFSWVMDALMLGVGVGWDTKGKDKGIEIYRPAFNMSNNSTYVIPDTREGWADSVRLLVNQYLKPGQKYIEFDYSEIRPQGAIIKGFGGTASGPDPLIDIHLKMRELFSKDEGKTLGSRLIADLMNLIGTCVVAGNVRRSAEIGLGDPDDDDFINLKNADVFPERNSYDPENPGWGWMSNNTLSVKVGQDYSKFTDLIANNGEPGFIWMDLARSHGRLADPANSKDRRVAGINPCAEQTLESFECCTLVEVHINRAESKEDFLRTMKFAYLYGKTITLLNTHWDRTNAVMQRNRRIGASVTGVSGFYDVHGLPALREWWNEGYEEIQRRDHEYSEWLGVRESIKTTSIKPSGTVSLLSGATPGVHWPPGGKHYLRAIRFSTTDPMVPKFMLAGYTVEQDIVSRNTVVVYFPIETQVRGEKEVSIFEKINLASEAQRHWADNAVSATISFDKKLESEHLPTVLNMYEGKLKTISFLPMGNDVYQQQPYTEITEDQYNSYIGTLQAIDMDDAYLNGKEAEGERFCATDVCEIKAETL